MNPNEFESRMREGEFFHSLQKPFDPRMHEQMVRTASALMEELG